MARIQLNIPSAKISWYDVFEVQVSDLIYNMNTGNDIKDDSTADAACKTTHEAALHDIELFKQPTPKEDCPICSLRLPYINTGWRYMSCCGKEICSGCLYAPIYDDQGNEITEEKCAFCRTPPPTSIDELIKRHKKRMEVNDPTALYNQGVYYRNGTKGFAQDYAKALEHWHRAAELGFSKAYCSIGFCYEFGRGVEIDMKKAIHYYELAAIRGNVIARNNLGIYEEKAGNMNRALKHYMIAVRDGDNESLKEIKGLYSNGDATKEDYTKALQSYQAYLGEIKSKQRDEAAADDEEEYRYY